MPVKKTTKVTALQRIWVFLNTRFVILVLSAVIISGAWKYYDQRQTSISDLENRRGEYGELIVEYQHRIALLKQADSSLDRYLGNDLRMPSLFSIDIREIEKYLINTETSEQEPIPCGPLRDEYLRTTIKVSHKEKEILSAGHSYAPTSPQFRGVDFLTLLSRIERVGGTSDDLLGSPFRSLGFLDRPPERLWLAVRGFLPTLADFGTSRDILYSMNQLPLPRGASLTKEQEAGLGMPPDDLSEADVERLRGFKVRMQERLKRAREEAAERLPCPDSP